MPLTLKGRHTELVPLEKKHAEDLFAAGNDDKIWRYMPVPRQKRVEETEAMIEAALAAARSGKEIPFAVVSRENGQAVGSTRYLDIDRKNRSLEIGWTWLGAAHQRTAVNTECKFLLLSHAFDVLGAVRVAFKTDARNAASQAAIRRIGATQEGIFRKHRIVWNGSSRDTVYFSILDAEWPGVKKRLRDFLAL